MKKFIARLENMTACTPALDWLHLLPEETTPQQAWDICEHGDWMLWLIGRMDRSRPYSDARKPIVACALECARSAWEWMPEKSRECIVLYERWCNGETISKNDLRNASASASDSATTAAFAAYTVYAYAAATAAYSAYAAAFAAAFATITVYSATTADATTAAYAAFNSRLRECARIVLKHYPEVPNVME